MQDRLFIFVQRRVEGASPFSVTITRDNMYKSMYLIMEFCRGGTLEKLILKNNYSQYEII